MRVKDKFKIQEKKYVSKQASTTGACTFVPGLKLKGGSVNPNNLPFISVANDVIGTPATITTGATGCMNNCLSNPECKQYSFNSSTNTCTLMRNIYSAAGSDANVTSGYCRNPWFAPNLLQLDSSFSSTPKCIVLPDGVQGRQAQIQNCDPNNPGQLFIMNQFGNFWNQYSGLGLNVRGAPTTANSQEIIAFTGSGGPFGNMEFLYDSINRRFVNPQSGGCLNVFGNNTAEGTGIINFQCSGTANEKFVLPRTCPAP